MVAVGFLSIELPAERRCDAEHVEEIGRTRSHCVERPGSENVMFDCM